MILIWKVQGRTEHILTCLGELVSFWNKLSPAMWHPKFTWKKTHRWMNWGFYFLTIRFLLYCEIFSPIVISIAYSTNSAIASLFVVQCALAMKNNIIHAVRKHRKTNPGENEVMNCFEFHVEPDWKQKKTLPRCYVRRDRKKKLLRYHSCINGK